MVVVALVVDVAVVEDVVFVVMTLLACVDFDVPFAAVGVAVTVAEAVDARGLSLMATRVEGRDSL